MNQTSINDRNSKLDSAVFAAGCFWCVEAQFSMLNGVNKVISGYMGGSVENPTYEQVCTGNTGHAEVCQIIFDPYEISYEELLSAFFLAHDPTQLNRQGNDIGTQYRSEIFYHSNYQKETAEYYIHELNKEKVYDSPIVTKVSALTTFFPAEDYHNDYYRLNPEKGYCQMVIRPKVDKFKKVFKEKLNKESIKEN